MLKYIIITIAILLPSTVLSAAEQNIHIEWSYEDQQVEDRVLEGFHLYKEGELVCTSMLATARDMDCVFNSEYGVFNFTLTAFFEGGFESPHSITYVFNLTGQGAILLAPIISTVQFN